MKDNNFNVLLHKNSGKNQNPILEDLKILRLNQVKELTGLGRTSIYDMMASGNFPRSVSLGTRAIGWRCGDIKAWLIDRQPG